MSEISVLIHMTSLKTCSTCKQDLDVTRFNKRRRAKDGLQHQCKQCQREGQNKYYRRDESYKQRVKAAAAKALREKRQKLRAVLDERHCVQCGEADPVVLDFDHIDPTTKLTEIGTMFRRGYSWDKIEAEIAKCQVLCSNCHRRKTAKEFGWHKQTKTGSREE